jgi:hypothetical protein
VVVVDGFGGSAEQPQDGMASTINCAGQKGNDGGATFNNQLRVRQPNGVIHRGAAVESIVPAKSQTEIGDGGVAMRCTMILDDRGNGNPFLFPRMK